MRCNQIKARPSLEVLNQGHRFEYLTIQDMQDLHFRKTYLLWVVNNFHDDSKLKEGLNFVYTLEIYEQKFNDLNLDYDKKEEYRFFKSFDINGAEIRVKTFNPSHIYYDNDIRINVKENEIVDI